MPVKKVIVTKPAPRLVASGNYILVVDYLDVDNMPKVETQKVVSQPAGLTKMHTILEKGFLFMEKGVTNLIPPHRILKLSVGEEYIVS